MYAFLAVVNFLFAAASLVSGDFGAAFLFGLGGVAWIISGEDDD
jgi:hypothetical protein